MKRNTFEKAQQAAARERMENMSGSWMVFPQERVCPFGCERFADLDSKCAACREAEKASAR